MSHPSMSEKELLNDLLNEEKQIVKAYATYVTEASCQNLRQLLIRNMTECSEDQYNIFDQMRQRQMYNPKDAQSQDVTQAKESIQTLKQQTGM